MTDKSPVSGVNQPRKFFDVATDPCDHNPFPAEDPRHGIWRRATRRAEEKLSELAELMPVAYRTRLENEWKRVESELFKYGRPLSTISMSPLLVPYYQGTFDIWAWRNLAAIAADGDLLIYDRWLLQYAQNWIELIEGREEPEGPKRSLVNDLQTAFRVELRTGNPRRENIFDHRKSNTRVAKWKPVQQRCRRPSSPAVRAAR